MISVYKLLIFLICYVSKISGAPRRLFNVTTSRGTVIGGFEDEGTNMTAQYYGQAYTFYGIPFAQPPMRFGKPQRIVKFPEDPYNATYLRPMCIQGHNVTDAMSEDCLYLDILSPNISSTSSYAVMVWIHGGGLTQGNGQLFFKATIRNLVSRGVVLVTIQYRLGFLGFFTTNTDDFPANLGFLDQVEALKFVQEEISNFGGDPKKVTIFGQSAGSVSVSAHTYSPLSQNFFQQSIQESGAALSCFDDALGPTYRMIEFAHQACNYTPAQWNTLDYSPLKDCLMNIDLNLGLKAASGSTKENELCWDFVRDDNFFPGLPRTLYKNRVEKPAMIGTMKDEYAWIVIDFSLGGNFTQLTSYNKTGTEKFLKGIFTSFFTNHTDEIYNMLVNNYFDPMVADDDYMAWLQFYVDVTTSFFFTSYTARDVTYHLANNNTNVYLFEFTYPSRINGGYNNIIPDWHPVPHMAEIPYVFYEANWEKDLSEGIINQTDLDLTNFCGEAWTNFAKYGKPTMDDSWKPTTSSDPNNMEYFEIGANRGMRTGYRKHDQITFNQLLPKILGEIPPDVPNYGNGSLLGCPAGYTQSKIDPHKCFNAFEDISNYGHNRWECQTILAELASIDNAFENSELQKYISSYAPNCTTAYIGYFNNGFSWRWVNGDNSTYTNWESGNPLNNTDSTCAVFNLNTGKWTSQDCNTHRCYICGYLL